METLGRLLDMSLVQDEVLKICFTYIYIECIIVCVCVFGSCQHINGIYSLKLNDITKRVSVDTEGKRTRKALRHFSLKRSQKKGTCRATE